MERVQPAPVLPVPASRWQVRTILFGIVFALILPGLVFGAILLVRIAGTERVRSEEIAEAAALRIAESLDHEVGNLFASLTALATSPALDDLRVDGFARQARTVALALGHDIVLCTPEGQQLFNTAASSQTAGLPRMGAIDAVQETARTRSPTLSHLFVSPTDGQAAMALMVPKVVAGQTTAILAINLRPAWLMQLLAAQSLPPGWTAAVLSRSGQLIAAQTGGGPDLLDMAGLQRRLPQGRTVWFGTARGGTRVLSAMQRAPQTDWRIVVAAPVRAIDAPLRNTVALLAVAGAGAMLVATLLAWRLASSVRRPLQRLAGAGQDLAQGRPVLGVQSAIAEVDAVSRALVQATQELRNRNDALAQERALLAAVIETVPTGIVIADAAGRIVASNRFVQDLARGTLEPGDGDGTRLTATHADGTLVRPEEYPLARILAGADAAELSCLGRRVDGSTHWIKLMAAPIRSEGATTGVVVAVLDIDETVRSRQALAQSAERLEAQVAERTLALQATNDRLRAEMEGRATAEEQLRQSQKMEAVGQLTGGLAHDFNNLLTIVMGSLDLLRRRAADDRARRLIDNALEGTTRAATLTARLLAFSRRQPLQPQPVDAGALVAGMSELLRTTLGDGIRVETAAPPGLWLTHVDPNQLESALLNLAVNARDAMRTPDDAAPRGTLSLLAGNATLGPEAVAGEPDVAPGDFVRIAVADDGAGMPPDVAAHVFEPFFTTKPVGKGTGLGLSQVHGFVKQSGGHVTLRTAPGQGTVVTIYLPRLLTQAEAAPAPLPQPPPSGPAPTAGMTVLVVEDEDAVRRYSAEALRELGHAVMEAADGPAALRLLETRPEIDLLFADVLLPAMSGPRLAELARHRRPGLPVLFTSGFAGAAPDLPLPGNAPMLAKPFTLHALAEMLHRCTTAAAD